ncbi:DNA (cytosine-5)-methyltransferase 3B-like [Boleophthalmus pectinirostris]|uniref:DNA (cytosine-5)-methyltransferase 3B-like n=1 Tax=Boleophthalmus pectinirostris TaxID=150288 RepID=UPI00242A98D5|nr:DNA (cytosine-5)-methyltransferase 3B-like [Boleophthalmus pectinirostris]
MSAMAGSDVILISDSEDKPQETKSSAENAHPKPPTSTGTTKASKKTARKTTGTQNESQIAYARTLKEICSKTPYCLYADMALELDNTTCAVMIGYFDCCSGVSVVRRLNTLRINQPSSETKRKPVITKHTASSAADLLVDLLKTAELPLYNLKVFYCNIRDPEVNGIIVSKLKALNPHLVSLGGLACTVGRACQTGLLEYYSHVIDLINDIHFFELPECLGGTEYSVTLPISIQYTEIIMVIQNMSSNWLKVEEYFKELRLDVGLSRQQRICDQMEEPKVRLDFTFLAQALGTFRSFRDVQDNMARDMVVELQMTALLVNVCASSIFTPTATEEFVRKKDLGMLQSEKDLLPLASINVGLRARRYLGSLSFVVMVEEERTEFLQQAQGFYQTVLKILVENLPGQLSPLSMRNIGTLLKSPMSLKSEDVSHVQLAELGSQLGLCKSKTSNSPLASEYVNYIQRINDVRGFEGSTAGAKWLKVLDSLARFPILFKLVLTLLAFPRSLQLKHIFQSSGRSVLSPDQRKGVKRRYRHSHRAEREKDSSFSSSSSDEDRPRPHPTRQLERDSEDSDYTDNSSDVVDVTDGCKETIKAHEDSDDTEPEPEKPVSESIYVLEGEQKKTKHKPAKLKPAKAKPEQRQQGELVLISLEDALCWPAVTVPTLENNQEPDMKKVVWYGHSMTSEVCIEYLRPFADFSRFFSQNTFATVATYKDAVFLALREASARCQKQFSASFDNKEEILVEMLDWAFGGFKPTGPTGFAPALLAKEKNRPVEPSNSSKGKTITPEDLPRLSVSLYKLPLEMLQKNTEKKKTKPVWKGKGPRRKSSLCLRDTFEDTDMSPDYVPCKKNFMKRPYSRVDQSNKGAPQNVYKQPDQKERERIIRRIMEFDLDIDKFCVCCGTEDVSVFHPLFKGSLCLECKNNFTETLYRYDEDGYQSYCTICCYGMEVILCGNDSCCRSFCADCLNILVGEGTFDFLKDLDPWICYLCQPHETHGSLRPDWSIRVQELFANNSAMEFEPHRVYPSIPASLRRPIRVLSLFDGIATGYLVLKDLGFKVEKYVASEVCDDSIAVSTVNHEAKIIHVGDARFITQEHLDQWGPFDLLIGGSPCNDLSIVNPLRKGLYEGTGRLFFEYYRILQLLKPKEEDSRPFFWLFENVVFMNVHDRLNICRFLECNPVLVDAVRVSPANRSRYFWGNIPGMSRPITASQSDKLNLQDCLEIGRVARVTKVRTITTNSNSLKQGKNVSLLPVLQNGTEDTLWITEIEKIFGFPKHYTDVRNMNRQQRQKVLGKAWSVPVIRHLFAPLKDYFACEELPPLATSSASTSSSSSSPASPATPEILQLR